MAGDDRSPQDYLTDAGMFLSTQSEAQARAGALLPTTGSEDVGHLLKQPSSIADAQNQQNCLPNPLVEWIVDVEFEDKAIFTPDQLNAVMTAEWVEANGKPQLYGYCPTQQRWTYWKALNDAESYTDLKFGWQLFCSWRDTPAPLTADQLQQYSAAVRIACTKLGTAKLSTQRTAEQGATQALKLSTLAESSDRDMLIVLNAPPGSTFKGTDIWDVMLCLRLSWGDMDLFHWINESDVGDEVLFSVWTTTEPGYFLPEEIAAGRVQTENLVFGFSVPRCPAPLAVFEAMVQATCYAQQRLGGSLLDASESPLDEADCVTEIEAMCERLTAAGFKPGSDAALLQF